MTPTAVTDSILIDTNVLVYALDPANHAKQRIAIDLLGEISRLGRGAVSVQCLTGTFNALTRRIAQPLSAEQAVEHVADYASVYAVLELTSTDAIRACRVVSMSQISIWDALIWSVAAGNNVSTILTEDMQHRSSIGGVRYFNPFDGEFNLAECLDTDRDP